MANSKGRSSSGSRKRTSSSKRGSSKKRTNNSRNSYNEINPDIIVLLAIVLGVFLFLCNIKKVGDFGTVVSNIEFGLFGISAYAVPFLLIAFVFVSYLARENYIIRKRLICSSVIFAFMNIMFEECGGIIRELSEYSIGEIWDNSVNAKSGGGVIFGSIAYMMHKYLSTAGTIFICLIGCVICILIFLGREAIDGFKANSRQIYDTAREDAAYRKQVRNEQRDADRAAYEESLSNVNPENVVEEKYVPRYARKRRGIGTFEDKPVEEYNGEELTEVDKTPRRDKKVSGVAQNTTLVPEKKKDDILNGMHEIIVDNSKNNAITETTYATAKEPFDSLASGEMLEISPIAPEEDMSEVIGQRGVVNMFEERVSPLKNLNSDSEQISDTYDAEDNHDIDNEFNSEPEFDALGGAHAISEQFSQTDVYDTDSTSVKPSAKVGSTASDTAKPVSKPAVKRPRKKYIMPSTQLLKDMVNAKNGNINAELNDVAHKLMTTLDTFGVKAKLEGYSRGPAVTRFEIQPELGVRVNKITSLQDDIKLSLAATDIRIEAPIPGKSAVGIEIPNKTSEGVGLKELLDDREFKNFNSKIAFAVGKDISGNVVVTDIGKMPHMLIAGTTGSGKSVCINTLIMSVLYKATPDEVKFIMIDPKVVELGVYNGIPHLLIPVVTDPRKASAALNWAVNEMMRRYQLFAEKNVRDLKGYNSAIEGEINPNDPEAPVKLPQLVIIVDELADLMMVAAKEVEDSICRLAQLARACGIHLIIATQRPSVDVITGLIKANMPSRVAFAVNSGTDSRTILDMNGAEKLLGKGDMLFYPQGYPKPVRVQGAFVSDAEIGKVVEFITNQDYVTDGQEDLLIKMETASSGSGSASGQATSEGNDLDELFTLAGQFIIDTDKASIGALQRKFKIGFNRAARIMDQLTEAGVVSEEDGKKPRTVLMGPEQFEQYVEEYV